MNAWRFRPRSPPRLGNVIRRLSSDSDGEITAAMYAILRLLESCGGDIHTLAAQVENGGMSEKYREGDPSSGQKGPRGWLREGR